MNAVPTNVLVVDDSALYRQAIQNVLREVPLVRIVGVAANGIEALEKIEQLKPELLTLDVQMPDMDGIQLLQEIKRRRLGAKAIVVSSLTSEGAKVTTDALLNGAFDFILKPSSKDSGANRRQLRDALEEKISAFREAVGCRKESSRAAVAGQAAAKESATESVPTPSRACEAVILGTSTGGPEALKTVLPRLPAELQVPVFVVQHMPAQYTLSLATRLNEICALEVVEATDKAKAVAGKVMIAPGAKQLKLERAGTDLFVRVTSDAPENGVCPSVDYLIRSACNALDGRVLAVIMTGMGRDGVQSCGLLKQAGGYVFAQQQDDCVVYGMPKAVVEAKLADRVLPLGKIAPAIVRHVKRSRRA